MRTPSTHVALGDVASFVRGVTFKPDDLVDLGAKDSIACFRTKNVQDQIDLVDVWAIPSSFVKRDNKLVQEGDLLVSTANSWNLVGKCSWVPALPWPATLGGFISALRADRRKIDPRYLYWWFASPNTQAAVRNCARQTTNIANLSLERCEALPLPLPALPEQRRIAAILDQADALRRLRRQSLSRLSDLGQAIFREMVSSEKGACSRLPLGEVIKVSSGGLLTAKSQRGGNIPVFGGNGINGWHDVSNVPQGTIVLGRVGVYCGAVHTTDRKSWVTDNALIVSKKIDINTAYLAAALHHADLNQYAGRSAQPLISGSRIYPVEIIIPANDVQKRYEDQMCNLSDQVRSAAEHKDALELLFASLQHRAFRGGL